MAFNYAKFQQSNGMGLGLNRIWTYTDTTQTLAAITAGSFFDPVNEFNDTAIMVIGDLIWMQASDGTGFAQVTAIDPNITVAIFDAVLGAGAVGTANLADASVTTAKIDDGDVTSAKLAANTLQYAAIPVSAAEFNGAYAAPKLLVAAGGANTMIVVKNVMYEVVYGGAQFAAGGAFGLQYDSTINGAGTAASQTLPAATANAWAADNVIGVAGDVEGALSATTVNKGIYLSNATAAFTTGSSDIIVHIEYAIYGTVV